MAWAIEVRMSTVLVAAALANEVTSMRLMACLRRMVFMGSCLALG